MRWRCIGPFRGGRVVAVAGSYHDPNVFYFGGAAGGVWKTTDGGTYWRCVTDGYLTTSSIGALAVAPSDSNVIYAGTGESTIRIDVSHGDGVYKSTDAGRTWANIGLRDSRHIGKIRVHPDNPDTLWVAALGHAFGQNDERGVFKSDDGGQNWRKTLFVSPKAGAVDLSLDPNPRIVYATVWEAYRNFWQISSGGDDSGLWQSTDGGETWRNISRNPGLPQTGVLGKIGVVASPAKSGRVWALVEHLTDGGLYRSDDYGTTWERVSDNQNLLSRAWYYMHVTADPQDPDTVYINNLNFYKSSDGGKTFVEMATPHGDNHDLWIDPRNSRRMIQGNDGGANVSYTGGISFSTIYNQPTAQFYHLAADSREPFVVYGTQQDNSSIAVPSAVNHAAITWAETYLAGTGESGYIAVRPDNPDIIYVGAIGSSPGGGNSLQRYDHRTKQIRLITTWPEETQGQGANEHKYRFAWTYPIIISPHDPNRLYIGGNRVFTSTDEGQSWQPVSPDLTHADPDTLQPTGGPINRDAVGAEVYATVYALAESPYQKGLLWAGSDDGLLHISHDAGANWQDITPADLPPQTLISCIELSPFDAGTAYVAATRYKADDYAPYLYVTRDYGRSWQRINAGIAPTDFTRVIRTDPTRAGLLYVGTETGLYVSFDDGAAWRRFQLNLPVSPLHEILVRDNVLIAGTHGRSIWILDDIAPLRTLTDSGVEGAAYVFAPSPVYRLAPGIDWSSNTAGTVNYLSSRSAGYEATTTADGETVRTLLDAGENPPDGVIIAYGLAAKPDQPITLTFRNAAGEEIRSLSSRKADDPAKAKERRIPANAGWNRFVWDTRHAPVTKIEGSDPPGEETHEGPKVPPGDYTFTLKVGETELTQPFTIKMYESVGVQQDDLIAQYRMMRRIHAQQDRTAKSINRMRAARAQLDGWAKRVAERDGGKEIAENAKAISAKVLEVEKTLLIPGLRAGWADNLNQGTRLWSKLCELPSVVSMGDYRPTDVIEEVLTYLTGRIEASIAAFEKIVADDLAGLNAQIARSTFGAFPA